jgi:integrase
MIIELKSVKSENNTFKVNEAASYLTEHLAEKWSERKVCQYIRDGKFHPLSSLKSKMIGYRIAKEELDSFIEGRKKPQEQRTFSNEVIKTFKDHIQNHLKDEKFKSLFLNFFEQHYSRQIFNTRHDRYAVHNQFEEYLVTIFRHYTIELISWKQYCLSMKIIRDQNWEYNNPYDHRIQRMARKMLSDFYQYAIENKHLNTKGLTELKEHKEFLIWEERKSSKMDDLLSKDQFDKIGTNFPLESSLEQLHLIPGDDKRSPVILNLNFCKNEIQGLLLEFYQSELSVNNKQYNDLRLFIFLFRYSLLTMENEPQSITDFTFEVFKKQFRFYQKANIVNPTVTKKFSIRLVRFYVYLCKFIKKQNIQHNIFEGTFYNEQILGSNAFTVFYEKGYRLMAYNPFEEVPIENRWQLITPDGFANNRKNMPYGIDFLEVIDKSFREDLKKYVWKQSSMSVSTVASHIHIVIDFLNFIYSYKQLNGLNGNEYVNADFLEQWSYFLDNMKTATRNNYIKQCKSYLRFYKDKYQIPQLLIESLIQKPIDYDGGNPITKHDIDLFSREFQKQRTQGINGEICYIIFNLAATTKLRSGEILALERDCIKEKYEQAGVIKYHSKVSGNEKIKLTLGNEKINLIEKAICLTESAHSKAIGDTAKYIFVKEDYWKKDRIIELVFQFANTFYKIQKGLEGQLEEKYRPYSLRTTFIDNIYTEGIKDGLPTAVIAEMAGNGVDTARKFYRKTTETQEYAEAFAGVTISGVDVYGNILEEEDVEDLNPVKLGLGGCEHKSCVIDDEKFDCLMCPHFATTVSRIPLFKANISRLKILKESTLNSQERNVIEAELKLYTAYYLKLLEKVGGKQDVNNV